MEQANHISFQPVSGVQFELGTAPPGDASVVFASCGPGGEKGILATQVEEMTGLTIPDSYFEDKSRPLYFFRSEDGRQLIWIVTWGGAFKPGERLKSSLESVLSGEFGGEQHYWLPLLATHPTGVSIVESAQITVRAFLDAIERGVVSLGSQVSINAPESISDAEFTRVVDAVRPLLEPEVTSQKDTPEPATPDIESPRFQADRPVGGVSEDTLNRGAIAEGIFQKVEQAWDDHEAQSRPFVVHLSGRWGSGKSSILNFLRDYLTGRTTPEGEDPPDVAWIVIDFNAWRQQDLGKGWWALLNALARGAPGSLSGFQRHYFRLWDKWWRFLSGWWLYLWAGLIFIGLLVLAWPSDDATQATTNATVKEVITSEVPTSQPFDPLDWKGEGTTKRISEQVISAPAAPTQNAVQWVLGILKESSGSLALLGGVAGLLGTFLARRRRTSEAIMELDIDPMEPLRARFAAMVGWIRKPGNRRVAIFIDDLDRCDAGYVVELLQAIQTLYADVPVLYVVAADRDWVVSSYEQVYAKFVPDLSQPGQPLGYLFLKKIFQLSVAVPDVEELQQTDYLASLLRQPDDTPAAQTPDQDATRSDLKLQIDAAAGDVAKLNPILSFARSTGIGKAVSRDVFKSLLQPEVEAKSTQKLLDPVYLRLFDPNPRSLKRLVNAYSFRQAYAALSGRLEPADLLIRWSILDLRFPIATRALIGSPELADKIARDAHPKKADLFTDPIIDDILAPLTITDIERLRGFG